MKLLPDPVCKRITNLWALANDPGAARTSARLRARCCVNCKPSFDFSDFMLVFLIEREQKSRGEFDPIEIMIYLFEEARIKLLPEQEIAVALWDTHTFVYHHYFHVVDPFRLSRIEIMERITANRGCLWTVETSE